MNFSIGIYSCLMDPMDSIGMTFQPLIQHEQNFSKSLTNRKWTFPSESIRVQCIQTLGRTLHHETSGFPMESKRIRLDSGRQYWTTLTRAHWPIWKQHSLLLLKGARVVHSLSHTRERTLGTGLSLSRLLRKHDHSLLVHVVYYTLQVS